MGNFCVQFVTETVPDLISNIVPKNPLKFEALRTFHNTLHFYGTELSESRQLLAREPPHVVSLCMIVQYICSYTPYLQAVSSIRNVNMRHEVVTRTA
jgi:hypothetical protein